MTEREKTSPHLTQLSEVTPESVAWLWWGHLARGKLTLLAGDPGLGKSRFAFDVCARITTGAPWPDGNGHAPKGTVLLVLGEDGLGDTVRPAIDAMGGAAASVFVLEVSDDTGTRPVNLARDLALIENTLDDLRPELFVIDPLISFLGKTDSYKDAEVRGLLTPLLAVIERQHAALLAIAHLTKDAQRTALHRPGGSIAFVAAARLAFALAADPENDERRILAPLKSNICRPAPSLAFTLPGGIVQWEQGAVSLDAATLLAPATPGRDHHARAEAEDFLRALLADCPVESDRVFREAATAGITRNTLRRAKDAIGITARKHGLHGPWTWALPTVERVVPISKHIGTYEDTHLEKSTFEDPEDTQGTYLPAVAGATKSEPVR